MQKRKPSLGQNFLVDDSAVQRIVASLGNLRNRLVLEIGPGRGAITGLLASRAGTLVAIELDRTLAPLLQQKFAGNPAVTVLQQDILQCDLTQLAAQHGHRQALVVGNLPYYITSDILLHLMEHAGSIESAVVMMQREVAERITATPGHREYGMLSASLQMMAAAELLFTLPPGSFSPPPEVYSSVVRLTMRPRYAELGVERTEFERFLRMAFAQKRKTLARNLRNAGIDQARLAAGMEQVPHLDPNIRAEACTLEAMAELCRNLRP